jgi:methyltransferase (TIGR00027 family)
MRKGTVSRTALNVATFRALGTLNPVVPSFSDPVAKLFLPPRLTQMVAKGEKAVLKGKSPYPFWGKGMAIFHQFRTVLLDGAIKDTMPLDQVVILGAGLDSRAWRLPALEGTTVFEVDHPDTQAWKKQATTKFEPLAREVRFVGVDFQKDDLCEKVAGAGYDPALRTFWLMEGVAPYLSRSNLAQTLANVAQLAPTESRFAITYMNKNPKGNVPQSLFLKIVGEPLISAFTPEEFARQASGAGWTTLSDTGIEDWIQELTPSLRITKKDVGTQWFERIWIGSRNS